MADAKSRYEARMKEIIAQSTEFYLSESENLTVLKQLGEGMEEFLYNEKKIEVASEMELTSLVLNA